MARRIDREIRAVYGRDGASKWILFVLGFVVFVFGLALLTQ
ncbi:MAG TPA: hypothetical protein VJ983_07585 [candidate division Zixibacteria bacterium]|nr:hypothetical protein [candidate division Zixibacteria bacterium]